MSKKHIEDYYYRMVADYTEMKNVLDEMQNTIPEDKVKEATENIESIKSQVRLLETNYKRLSYIMYLLNMPNRECKQDNYHKREHKRLEDINYNDRQEGVSAENTAIISELKDYM